MQRILDIINLPYQQRSEEEHKQLIKVLKQYFIDLSQKRIKLLSFYLQKVQGGKIITIKQYSPYSFILNNLINDNPQTIRKINLLTLKNKIKVDEDNYALVVDYKDYVNCEILGQSSIQQQLNIMNSSQYLCSMPKKNHLWMLRNCQILSLKQYQLVFCQGQDIAPKDSGSGVYFIRSGQFQYSKSIPNKNKIVQVFRFSKGHIFGNIDIEQESQIDGKYPKRIFNAKSMTTNGVVYQFTKQGFINKIKPYCSNLLNKNQLKLLKFIPIKSIVKNKSPTALRTHQNLQKETNYQSSDEFQMQITNKKKNQLPTLKLRYSQDFAAKSLQKTNYLELKKGGPLKNYPLMRQRASFTDSQFKQLNLLMTKSPTQKQKQRQFGTTKGDYIFRILAKKSMQSTFLNTRGDF